MFGWYWFANWLAQWMNMVQNPCGRLVDGSDLCPAGTMNAITAAFATQGYWAQADVLYYLTLTDFGLWAPLLYVCAAIGALFGVATGAPPRNYIWFLLGPALYSWLIDTRQAVLGVRWMVGYNQMSQWEVWRLAEPGLRNMNVVQRIRESGGTITFDSATNKPTVSPPEMIAVSNAFLWWDEMVTGTVQFLVDWTGMNRQCNLDSADTSSCMTISGSSSGGSAINGNGNWFLIANRKWEILTNITGATISNPMLRDAFNELLASECGDELVNHMNHETYSQVTKSRGRELNHNIETIFQSKLADGNPAGTFKRVRNELSAYTMTLGPRFKSYLSAQNGVASPDVWRSADYSIQDFACVMKEPGREPGDTLDCAYSLWIIMQSLRLEASQIYAKVVRSLPDAPISSYSAGSGSSLTTFKQQPDLLPYFLFYGWNLTYPSSPVTGGVAGDRVTGADASEFLKNLILVYLFRNEIRALPIRVTQRLAASAEVQNYVDRSARDQTSYSKYGELYSWALMVPYVQGLLLYYLAMGFPFACLLVIVPGWHKSIFSWMAFWAWAKLWDVGFALVNTVERSVWAMMGGNSDTAKVHQFIVGMSSFGKTSLECPDSASSGAGAAPGLSCPFPLVKHVTGAMGDDMSCAVTGGLASTTSQSADSALRLFDRLMLLHTNVDLDLVTGYYIFIMSALYLAVPPVVGQLVLGAKAGMANLLTSGMGASGEVGRGAAGGFADRLGNRMNQAAAVQDQTAAAKAMMRGGLAGQAIGAQNQALDYGVMGGAISTASQNLGRMAQAASATASAQRAMGNVAQAAIQAEGALGEALLGYAGDNQALAKARDAYARRGGRSEAGSTVDRGGGALPRGGADPGAGSGSTSVPTVKGGTTSDGGADERSGQNAPTARNTDKDPVLSALNAGNKAKTAMANFQGAAHGAWIAAQDSANQTRFGAAQADLGIQGNHVSAMQQGARMGGDRLGEAAQFGMQSGVWDNKRARAEGVSGEAAASGLMSGTFNAGEQPMGMGGFAMNGMLGSQAKQAYGYTIGAGGGAFGQGVSSMTAGLSSSVGSSAVYSQYQAPSYEGVRGNLSAAAETMTRSGNGFSGGQMAGSGTPGQPGYVAPVSPGMHYALDQNSPRSEMPMYNFGNAPSGGMTGSSSSMGSVFGASGGGSGVTAPNLSVPQMRTTDSYQSSGSPGNIAFGKMVGGMEHGGSAVANGINQALGTVVPEVASAVFSAGPSAEMMKSAEMMEDVTKGAQGK